MTWLKIYIKYLLKIDDDNETYNLMRTPAVKWSLLLIWIGSWRDYRIVVIVVEVSGHFTCPEFTPRLPRRWRRVNFRRVTEFTPGLEGLKTLFSLNPGVTRDSRVTPGLPLNSKTGHKRNCWKQTQLTGLHRLSVNTGWNWAAPAPCQFSANQQQSFYINWSIKYTDRFSFDINNKFRLHSMQKSFTMSSMR